MRSYSLFSSVKCTPESRMDGESNNLRIAVSDSHQVYDQNAYGALGQSDSAYKSHQDDDQVSLYLAIEDTNSSTVNALEVRLNNVREATLTFYDEIHDQIFQIVRYFNP